MVRRASRRCEDVPPVPALARRASRRPVWPTALPVDTEPLTQKSADVILASIARFVTESLTQDTLDAFAYFAD
jgi:hypothetical protein